VHCDGLTWSTCQVTQHSYGSQCPSANSVTGAIAVLWYTFDPETNPSVLLISLPTTPFFFPSPSVMNNYPYSSQVHITDHVHPYNPDVRQISRTPSPTPSEIQALNQKGFVNWKSIFNTKQMWTRKRISASLRPSSLTIFIQLTFPSYLHLYPHCCCFGCTLHILPWSNCTCPSTCSQLDAQVRTSYSYCGAFWLRFITFQLQVWVVNSNSYLLYHFLSSG